MAPARAFNSFYSYEKEKTGIFFASAYVNTLQTLIIAKKAVGIPIDLYYMGAIIIERNRFFKIYGSRFEIYF